MQWRFGPYRLDLDNACLWWDDQRLPLRPKTFDILVYLVQRAGELVTKEALLDAVWPDTAVADGVLATSMTELRKALGETAREPRYIATVHRRGYRFLAAAIACDTQEPPLPMLVSPGVSTSAAKGFSPSHVPLVDREPELVQLHQGFAATRQGQRQVVFISGEAGIGKTTLVDVFLGQLDVQGSVRIGRGQCIDHYGSGEPYLPLLEALGHLGQVAEREYIKEVLQQYAPSWLLQLPSLLSTDEVDSLHRHMIGTTPERMLRELAEAVEAFTLTHDLVLVLEDLHWSDVSTLDWLAYIARRRSPARLMILGTYRPVDAVVRNHPIRVIVQELRVHRQCEELTLDYLSEAGVSAYLAQRFGESGLSDAVSHALHRRTNGNPLFLTEVIESLMRQGHFGVESTDWKCVEDVSALTVGIPETLQHFIEEQFRRLDAEDQALLEVASAVGMEFSSTTVAAALHMSQDEVETQCDILARNHRFVRSCGMMIWPDGAAAEQYIFTHALFQESLYEKLVPRRRVRLHQQIGEQMEASYGTRAQEIAAELAMHFERGQDYWRAVGYLQYAGEQARQRSAYQEAETYLRRGVTLLAALPESAARTEHELTLYDTLGVVVATLKGLASPEAGQIYAHAHALCQQLNDTPRRFHILAGLRRFYSSQGDLQTARSIAGQLYHLAQHSRDPQQLIEAHFSQGLVSFCLGDLSVCRTYLEHAWVLDTPQPYPAPPASGHQELRRDGRSGCLSYASFALWVLGYPDQAIQRSEAAIHHAQQQSPPSTRALALQFASCLRQFRRETRLTQRLAEAAMTLATDYALGHWLGQSMILHGWATALQEEGQTGLQQMCDGLATKEATGSELLRPYYLSLLAEVYGKVGQPATGLAVLKEAMELVDKNNERWCIAELYRLRGELLLAISMQNQSESASCFHLALDCADQQQAKSWELRAAMSLARLWQPQGKRQEAYDLLQPVYGWFTEGFDTADLQAAKSLLDELEYESP